MLDRHGTTEHLVGHDDIGQSGLFERQALRVGAVIGVEAERDRPRLHPYGVEDVRKPYTLPVDARHDPSGHTVEVPVQSDGRHAFRSSSEKVAGRSTRPLTASLYSCGWITGRYPVIV